MVTCLTGDSISLILDAFCQYNGFLELYFQSFALFSKKNSLKKLSSVTFSAPRTRVKLSSNPDYINANWIRVSCFVVVVLFHYTCFESFLYF